MAARALTVAIVLSIILSSCAPAWSADEREGVRHETIYLLHADARQVALMFGAAPAPAPESGLRARAGSPPRVGRQGRIPPGAVPDPTRRPELAAWAGLPDTREQFGGATADVAPFVGGGFGGGFGFGGLGGAGTRELLPGDMSPPILIPGQNALLVTGTPAELDAFREIVQLLDAPLPQVRIRGDIVSVLTRIEKAEGADFMGPLWRMYFGTVGNVPPDASMALRFGTANFAAVLGAMERQNRGRERVGAEVMTMTNSPALLAVGQTIPYFVPETVVTQGVVRTNYIPVGAFVGIELYVVPRVNADDTVSMMMRVSLVDETGTILGPGGAAPVTKQVLSDALLRIPDGETVCIAGLPRRQESTNTTPLGEQRIADDSELLVFVTPTILRPIAKP